MKASKHKSPLLGWHPPAELSAWVREEAAASGTSVTVILNTILVCARDGVPYPANTSGTYGKRK